MFFYYQPAKKMKGIQRSSWRGAEDRVQYGSGLVAWPRGKDEEWPGVLPFSGDLKLWKITP